MPVTQIKDALPGEDLIGIEPALLQQADAGWLQRLCLFTGRTLSDTALTNEQAYRAGRLTLLGQAVTHGVVQGLDLSVDLSAADPALQVAPGYGIAASGQDVTLLRALRTTLSALTVIDGQTGAQVGGFKDFTAPAAPWAGVFLLQPIVADATGSAVDTGPANLIVSGNLGASCDQDPQENAFGDSQIVDGCRLVLATWPAATAALALPAPLPAASWRNRLAYTVFDAELALTPDDRLPWDMLGVPLALAGFGAGASLLFADRGAVIREGGLPRRRYVVPGPAGLLTAPPALANARVGQLAEQLGAVLSPASPPGLVVNTFAFLPPSGVLPPFTMDFVNQVALWAPSNWSVSVAPIFAEELDGILRTGMTAAPLDTTQNETVEVLVPLPDSVFDPDILLTEAIDPAFQQEVDAATLARTIVLQHRHLIEQEANALAPALAQPAIDTGAGLTASEIAERDGPAVIVPNPSETFAVTLTAGAYQSSDIASLLAAANAIPVKLLDATDTAALQALLTPPAAGAAQTGGLQGFIDGINARLAKANDLLDLAFLTTQTDIYRYRQNVLNTTDASRLATSPILANIATGVTAAATAQNIQDYLATLQAQTAAIPITTPPPTTTTAAPGGSILVRNLSFGSSNTFLTVARTQAERPAPAAVGSASQTVRLDQMAASAEIVADRPTIASVVPVVSPADITQQSPIVGAELDLRTLTIAERLAPSPSQEAMFYVIGNRVAFLQLLADLDLVIDDIPILVDTVATGVAAPTMADLRPAATAARTQQVLAMVQNVNTGTNPDEGSLFATGIRVLEQHSMLLRALEARIQQYRDFLTQCGTALASVQTNFSAANQLIAQLTGDLTQARQNLAFAAGLLADETARVGAVNATRASILQTYVPFVAFTRQRTLGARADAPSRQLLPADVASPVPACLQQHGVVPPELREMVALLREAPLVWFPPIGPQLSHLERPALLQSLAADTQARAALLVQSPLSVSSAATATGLFAGAIAARYTVNQQVIAGLQGQRAQFQPVQLASQSWASMAATLRSVVAVGDLLSSDAVHAEISGAASQWLTQVSTVATCLYTRVGQVQPIDRLAWAQYVGAQGASAALANLAVLPGWTGQDYLDRQQMQLIVDWLFQQVDASNATAYGLMNDVVAVAILLASQAPVDDIIAGAVAQRSVPQVGGSISLTLPSDRVAHGMSVQLYGAGVLTARAVVSDLDSSSVTAMVTDVYAPGTVLEINDVAHYTAQGPDAVVYKAFAV